MKSELATTAAGAAGIGLVTGSILGLPVIVLVAGFFGGVVAIGLLPALAPEMSRFAAMTARIGSLVVSTITASFMGPYLAALFHAGDMAPDLELRAVCFVVGFGAQVLMPALIAAVKRRIDQLGGVTPQ